MGENSEISWTDHTFNPWMGCTKVSPACTNCYAERDMDHRYGKVAWGQNGTRVVTSDANWQKPLKWNKDAIYREIDHDDESGFGKDLGKYQRPRVFCASLADVFEDWQGPMLSSGSNPAHLSPTFRASSGPHDRATMSDVRRRLFSLIDATPNLDWLLLTKRPENILRMWPDTPVGAAERDAYHPYPPPGGFVKRDNVWLGCSVENQEFADKRIPELLKCRDLSPVLFLSCEPVVGPIELKVYADICPNCNEQTEPIGMRQDRSHPFEYFCGRRKCMDQTCLPSIDWVIAGGESGPEARQSDTNWFLSLRDQCDASGIPFHFKQWGEYGETGTRVGKKKAGRVLDGRTHDEFPRCESGRA